MDGHDHGAPERTAPPAGFMEVLHARDPVLLATQILKGLPRELEPVDIPTVPLPSDALAALMTEKVWPTDLKPDALIALKEEHEVYCSAVLARADAKGTNVRRLRASLWAEATLRKHGRPEHSWLRAFNRDKWGVSESASQDMVEREEQVRAAQ